MGEQEDKESGWFWFGILLITVIPIVLIVVIFYERGIEQESQFWEGVSITPTIFYKAEQRIAEYEAIIVELKEKDIISSSEFHDLEEYIIQSRDDLVEAVMIFKGLLTTERKRFKAKFNQETLDRIWLGLRAIFLEKERCGYLDKIIKRVDCIMQNLDFLDVKIQEILENYSEKQGKLDQEKFQEKFI